LKIILPSQSIPKMGSNCSGCCKFHWRQWKMAQQ